MTPAAPAGAKQAPHQTGAKPPPHKTAAERTAPARRRKSPGSPSGPVPRRVSGPVAAPAAQPRREPAEPRLPRSRPARKQTLSQRLATLLRSLPDHPLLDRLVRGRAWIPLLGVMLVGIVAMQVELLKLNASTGRSIELIGSLQGRNDLLHAQVASASDPNRIERLAGRMGMTMPGPASITFVKARSASARRALAGIRVPNLAAFEAALRASNAATQLPAASPPQTAGPANGAGQAANTTSTASGAQTNSTAQTTSTTTAPATTSSPGASTGAASPPPATAP